MDKQRHRDTETETQRHRDTETQRQRDTETQRHRDTETQRQRHRDTRWEKQIKQNKQKNRFNCFSTPWVCRNTGGLKKQLNRFNRFILFALYPKCLRIRFLGLGAPWGSFRDRDCDR